MHVLQVMEDGGVRFVNHKSKAVRLPVTAALVHPYLQQVLPQLSWHQLSRNTGF